MTDPEQSYEALRRSEENLRTLMEQVPDGVAVYRDGRFVYANRALVEVFGYESPEDLVGEPVIERVHAEDRDRVVAQVEAMLETGEPAPLEQVRYLTREGEVVEAEVSAQRILFDGKPSILAVVRDASERRRLMARIMKMDRMLSVGALAAGVGHEINNPLTYVTENVKFALERLEQEDTDGRLAEVREALEEARHGARRVGLVVRDLKTFSRTDEHSRELVAIEDLVESVTSMAWNEIKHRAKLVKDLRPGLHVMANRPRLAQALLNLLVNAAHSIEEGRADRNSIRIRSFERDDDVLVEIEDTGVGIPPQVHGIIFKAFYTTKPEGQGTGLGLTICREIVDEHGGELYLQSEVGRGSTFTVVLPRVEPAGEDGAKAAAPLEDEARRARILVVDDEAMICSLVSRALGKQHDVVTLTDAREALDLLKKGERFDLIFCDLMMPDMTGMELYAEVDMLSPVTASRMVFLTGGAFTPRAREFLESVENRRLDKPFEVITLRTLVRELLR